MVYVNKLMHRNIPTIHEEDDVKSISRMLSKSKLSGLPVVGKNKKLIGFISVRDIITEIPKKDFIKKKAKDVMKRDVVVVEENVSVDEVARIFSEKTFRLIPVVKKGRLVGMVKRTDLIKRLLIHYY